MLEEHTGGVPSQALEDGSPKAFRESIMSEVCFLRGVTTNYLLGCGAKVFLGANASNLFSLFHSILGNLLVLNFGPLVLTHPLELSLVSAAS